MSFLKASGIEKLKDFAQDVKAIYQKYEAMKEDKDSEIVIPNASRYSDQMALKALEICQAVIENNEKMTSFKKIKKMFIEMKLSEQILYIDNNSGTGVPAVFNQESLELAECFIKFLKKLTLADLGSGLELMFKGIKVITQVNPQAELKQHILEIMTNINTYNIILDAKKALEAAFKLKNEIADFYGRIKGQFNKSVEPANGTFFYKLKNNEFKDFAEIKEYYKENVSQLLNKMKTVSYVTLRTDFRKYLNAGIPYTIDMRVVETACPGLDLLKELQFSEKDVNDYLQEKGMPCLSVVSDFAKATFTEDKLAKRKKDVADLYAEFKEKAKELSTGNHLSFFKKVDPQKTLLLKNICDLIESTLKEEDSQPDHISRSLLVVYKAVVTGADENIKLSKAKKKSIGKTGLLLRIYQNEILSLALTRAWGDDEDCFARVHPESAIAKKFSKTQPKPRSRAL